MSGPRRAATASTSQKPSLRTSILDKNLERERRFLLENYNKSHSINRSCNERASLASRGSNRFYSLNNNSGGYGSLQPCCESSSHDNVVNNNCNGNNNVDKNEILPNNILSKPPIYMRSFSSGPHYDQRLQEEENQHHHHHDQDRHSNNEDEGISFKTQVLKPTSSNQYHQQEHSYHQFGSTNGDFNGSQLNSICGSRSDVWTSESGVVPSHLLDFRRPKRYEIPAIYFGGRGSSARNSFSSVNTQIRVSSARNFQQVSSSAGLTSPQYQPNFHAFYNGDHSADNQTDQDPNHLCLKMDDMQPLANVLSNQRSAGFYTNAANFAAGDVASDASATHFDEDGDLFLNFNETLDRLPNLQRELGQRLRRHLQFFFMNPLQKYQIRRQFPFKLFLQILKVAFITIQLILFAELRISHVDFLDDSATVMRHRFLKDWDNDRDEVVYPPDSGKYSVYSGDQIFEHIGFIVKSYYTIHNDSFASFSYDTTYPHRNYHNSESRESAAITRDSLTANVEFARIPPIQFCRDRIADVTIQNDTYIFDISPVKECFSLNLTLSEVKKVIRDLHAIRDILRQRNITFTAEDALSMSKATLSFNLRTIHFSPLSTDQKPECYLIKISIEFDNSRHTGQVFIKLNSIISYVNLCNGRVLQVFTLGLDALAIGVIDCMVLTMCLMSLLLCTRALIKAHLLKKTTCDYFATVFGRRLTVTDQLEFFNLWYVMILINDVLIALGTICKVTIEFRDFDSDLFTLTGILLGLGALLVYIGLLRYLGFFSQYNILVLTLKRSLPSILRFMVCTIILYMGFLIAGWVIIGPYSIKFRTLAQSSEALFSLLNGDDMFATFYTISDSSTTIKVVGTIYIYFFVSLFIYIVLSLFIAIIMDSYEVVKERYNQSATVERSTLFEFLASAEPPNEGTNEAREVFASDRLLRLDDSWLLQNWGEIRASLRRVYDDLRRGRNGIQAMDNPLLE